MVRALTLPLFFAPGAACSFHSPSVELIFLRRKTVVKIKHPDFGQESSAAKLHVGEFRFLQIPPTFREVLVSLNNVELALNVLFTFSDFPIVVDVPSFFFSLDPPQNDEAY